MHHKQRRKHRAAVNKSVTCAPEINALIKAVGNHSTHEHTKEVD